MTSVTEKFNIDVPTLVEALKRSGLIKQEDLKRSLKSIALTTDEKTRTVEQVAEQLISSELVTRWQAAQLLRGKYRGFRIGSYLLRRPIGRGGMGIVYEGQHVVLGTRVAIKFLPKSKSDSDKSVSRFLAEARAAAKLSHPNIVRVHDCNVAGNRLFMVMDLVEGSNLADIVRKQGPLSYFAALTLLQQAALGLGHAHDNGITHRDVKPQNFLVDKQGQLKVADLGLALFEIDSPDRYTQDGTGAVLGTVDFLAPEQAWDSTKVDRRADIYSLGCTLYFMLTGKAPFDSGSLAQRIALHQTGTPTPISQVRPDCPPAVWNLCQKMLAKQPQHRIQKMSEIASICSQILPGLSAGSLPNGLPASSVDGLSLDGSGSFAMAASSDSGSVDFGSISMDTQTSNPSMTATLPTGDMSGTDPLAQPMGATPVAGAYAAPAQKKTPVTSNIDLKAIYNKIGIVLGLILAVCAIGISVYLLVVNGPQKQKLKVKQYETPDGNTVIVVDE